ncbi:MAG TPA: rRNA pseudouridine synthase [Flavobacteriales bacterium]|nr:rRNA pseudouridine synthase [Flavobacteriales bacterium]
MKENTNPGIQLNKFISHCGIASRRKAAEIIKSGEVIVDGKVVTEPGYRVQKNQEVKCRGKAIRPNRNYVYLLLNKPKNFITTTEDDRGRKTVMDLIKQATKERVYPVGRLDKNTVGLLLFTNDGELAEDLSHPSKKVKKIYHVFLNKPLTKIHFEQILKGLELEDGQIMVDDLAFPEPDDTSQVGIELHSGRNRIVRRIFESLGYEIVKLDRVVYAGLTKKNLPRGKWRFLTKKELLLLRHFT